jgi:hypothetical protein
VRASRPTIVIHSLDHARAALRAARDSEADVTLASASAAGCYAGPAWWAALIAVARREFPGVPFDDALDCADHAGVALGALRAGVKRVRFTGEADAAARLSQIASQLGAVIETAAAEPACDLRDSVDPEGLCRRIFSGNAALG